MRSILVALSVSMVISAMPARADVVALVCNDQSTVAKRVLNVDVDHHTVTVVNKSSQAFPAQITDLYVIWSDPFADGWIDNRLERETGDLEWKRPDRSEWLAGGACKRLEKKPLL